MSLTKMLLKQVLQTLSYSHIEIWGEEMKNVNGLQMLRKLSFLLFNVVWS